MKAITERTLIPVSLLLVIGGGVAWLTNLHSLSVQSADAIMKIEQKQDRYVESIEAIRRDIAEIKGEVRRIPKTGR